jgi:hypothetical protein
MAERKRRSRSAAKVEVEDLADRITAAVEVGASSAGPGAVRDGPRPRITKLILTRGEKLYQPVQYNHFKTGPFTAEVEVGEGDDPQDVALRTMAELDAIERTEFEAALASFAERRRRAKRSVDA